MIGGDLSARVGIRPILGATLTVSPDEDAARHGGDAHGRSSAGDTSSVVVLAVDDVGYANLCRLVTDAHMLGERGEPSLTSRQICAHADGLGEPNTSSDESFALTCAASQASTLTAQLQNQWIKAKSFAFATTWPRAVQMLAESGIQPMVASASPDWSMTSRAR